LDYRASARRCESLAVEEPTCSVKCSSDCCKTSDIWSAVSVQYSVYRYIFELLRYTCEWISESIASRHNSERDIDMFVKSHIFSCLKGVTDQHLASALDSPDNAEGYHVDWMFTRHDLSNAKIDSDTLKLQKTLRDMHKALLKDISTAGSGAVTKPVLNAFTKLIMPGFVFSFFFLSA
ncbi:hypothetical protein BC937DRAFT_86195, partial [Endogone sp. FLAS-F59071]